MWSLVRAELVYHRLLLALLFAVAMPLAAVQTAAMDDTEIGGIVALTPFVVAWALTSVIFESRNRERRDRLLALLPVATHQVALSRLVMAVGPFALALLIFAAVREAISPDPQIGALLRIGVGLCLAVYGGVCVVQDLCSAMTRRALKGRLAAALVFALVMGMGVFVATTRGQPHPILAWVFTAPIEFLRSPQGQTRFLFLSLVLGFVSVITYSRRKSYLQT